MTTLLFDKDPPIRDGSHWEIVFNPLSQQRENRVAPFSSVSIEYGFISQKNKQAIYVAKL